MNIIIKKTLDVTEPLETYVDEKFLPLEKLVQHFETEGELVLHVEIARSTAHHKKGEEIFEASASLALPKQTVHAEAAASDARVAIDRVRDVMKEEIETYKGKHFDHYRSEKER